MWKVWEHWKLSAQWGNIVVAEAREYWEGGRLLGREMCIFFSVIQPTLLLSPNRDQIKTFHISNPNEENAWKVIFHQRMNIWSVSGPSVPLSTSLQIIKLPTELISSYYPYTLSRHLHSLPHTDWRSIAPIRFSLFVQLSLGRRMERDCSPGTTLRWRDQRLASSVARPHYHLTS